MTRLSVAPREPRTAIASRATRSTGLLGRGEPGGIVPCGMSGGPGHDFVIFIVAGDLGLLDKNEIHRATPPVPENTVESVKRDVATVQERIKR